MIINANAKRTSFAISGEISTNQSDRLGRRLTGIGTTETVAFKNYI